MKFSQRKNFKRLMLAALAATSLVFSGSASAEDVKPESPANNDSVIRSGNYDNIYGGGSEANSNPAHDNTVTVYGGNISGIFGGMTAFGNSARNNVVIVHDGQISGVVGGVVIWHSSLGGTFAEVSGNRVEIYGGTVNYVSGGEIAYGYMTSNSDSDPSSIGGDVHDNSVLIRGGNIGNDSVSGIVIGGAARSGSAHHNTIIISGGTILGNIIGGHSDSGLAHHNTIEISGGTISGNIIGGRSDSGSAQNNTITIEGRPNLSGATLWGGLVGSSAYSTGNTLNINTWGVEAQNIYGFENINFNLPYLGSGNILTLTNGETDLSSFRTFAVVARADSGIRVGTNLPLIYNANGLTLNNSLLATSADEIFSAGYTMNGGVSFDYPLTLQLSADGTSLVGTVGEGGRPKPDNPVTPVSIANIDVPNGSTDNVINSINDYVNSKTEEDDDGYFVDRPGSASVVTGFELFGDVGASNMRKNISGGGHIKNRAINTDLGLARTYERGGTRWVFAPVFEYGKGNYDAYITNSIKGYGTTKYAAGGLIGRKMNNAGYYLELSARVGRSKNDFASDDFQIKTADGSREFVRATYDTSSTVFAGHVRLGQARRLNRSNLLDVYGIFAYSHQGSDNTTLSVGDAYRFSSISSARFRLGYRLTTRTSRISRIYTGLAYQYEHTSDSRTEVRDLEGRYWRLPHTGSKGSSVMLELGWLIKPRKDNPWLVDISAQGWLGHQRGLAATANLKKSF